MSHRFRVYYSQPELRALDIVADLPAAQLAQLFGGIDRYAEVMAGKRRVTRAIARRLRTVGVPDQTLLALLLAKTKSEQDDNTLNLRESIRRSGVHRNKLKAALASGQIANARLKTTPCRDYWRIPPDALDRWAASRISVGREANAEVNLRLSQLRAKRNVG